ncbi:hypothetical protein C8Q80DRAFT_1218371 [Daedaleopsis nitida]|nr:hypothetical protein C8Q80DRAFT_1218371 [Daedaleopsis nitida]
MLSGCCIHKDLNTFKGGSTALTAFWKEENLVFPVLLMNKDNVAAAATGDVAASSQAIKQPVGGADKLAQIGGGLFWHSDDKKGQQDSARHYFNSHGDASLVLVAYLPLWCELIEQVQDKKNSGQWNNMEEDFNRGIHNIPTLTELVVFCFYSELVSHSYMHAVRGADNPNHLDLGALHERVIQHVQAVIDNPDLILAPNADPDAAMLDGQPWDHPDAFVGAHNYMPALSHLCGALKTWKRFAGEYASDGKITTLSPEERECAWQPAMNGANEGELGSGRVTFRSALNMTLHAYNSRTMYKTNGTSEYVETLAAEDLAFVQSTAHAMDQEGLERKCCIGLADPEAEESARKKADRQMKQAKKDDHQSCLMAFMPTLRWERRQTTCTVAVTVLRRRCERMVKAWRSIKNPSNFLSASEKSSHPDKSLRISLGDSH